MERVHTVKDKPAEQVEVVGVSVSWNRRHIGVLHKVDLSPPQSTAPKYHVHEVRLLHLGWHGKGQLLNDTDLTQCAAWVSPDIEPEQGEAIAGYCRLIHNRNLAEGTSYGFGSAAGFFGVEGEMLPEFAKMGLTCATFVLAVFHRGGVPLV